VGRDDGGVVRVWKEHVACFADLDHRADRRRLAVDDGNRPVTSSDERAQSLDLRAGDVTRVAGVVHVGRRDAAASCGPLPNPCRASTVSTSLRRARCLNSVPATSDM
jgi:hypothetical protein